MPANDKAITVITSTIGRAELRQCIESVLSQKYPFVSHFVFVNGPQYHDASREILSDYPEVTAFYLPEETGDYGMGPSMADVFVAASFLTRADWVFFLDDDNFFDPNHVESLMSLAMNHDLKWAYSLRRIVAQDGSPICDDDWCSLGYWPDLGSQGASQLVDNSCYAVSLPFAKRYALAWTARPSSADRCFFLTLHESGARYGCTGLSTTNYRIGLGTAPNIPDAYLANAKLMRDRMPNGFPWRKESIFEKGQIIFCNNSHPQMA